MDPASPCVSVGSNDVATQDTDLVHESPKLDPASPCVSVGSNDVATQDTDLVHESPKLDPASPCVSVGSNDVATQDTDLVHESPKLDPASPCVSVGSNDVATQDTVTNLVETEHEDSPPASPSATVGSNNAGASDNNPALSDFVDSDHQNSPCGSSHESHIEELNQYSIKQCKVVVEQLDLALLETNVRQTAKSLLQVKKCSVVLCQLTDCDVKKYKDNRSNVLPSVSKSVSINKKPIKTRSYIKQKQAIVPKYLYKCSKCVKKFVTQNRLYKHERTHSVGRYVCTVCKRHFQYLKTLRDHKVTHTPNLMIKCTVRGCAKKYASAESLKYHLTTHNGYRHKCTYCNFKSTTKQNLIQHLRGSHGQGVLKARCGKNFAWPSLHQQHQEQCKKCTKWKK